MSASTLSITGLVLAGGQGRRMGGADKGLMLLNGRPLVAHVIARLAPQVDRIIISANRNLETYTSLGYPVVADAIGDFPGPLAGLQAGLNACATPFLVTVPCDTPCLPEDLVARLALALPAPEVDVAVASTAGGLQPAFALMRKTLFPDLTAFLASGERKLQAWYGRFVMRAVYFEDEAAFFNANTPGDLDHLAQDQGIRPPRDR